MPAHSFKFAARCSTPRGGDAQSWSHHDARRATAPANPVSKRIEEATDVFSFLFEIRTRLTRRSKRNNAIPGRIKTGTEFPEATSGRSRCGSEPGTTKYRPMYTVLLRAMKVYKFGASVRNADGVQNLLKIIGDERDLFIIVSAMGKTTNALEKVSEGCRRATAFSMEHITALRQYRRNRKRTVRRSDPAREIERLSGEPNRWRPKRSIVRGRAWYDTVVAFGDLDDDHFGITSPNRVSTIAGSICDVLPHRTATQDASVDIAASWTLLQRHETVKACIFIRQGFIGGARTATTTLGREGSDYSAAVAANVLDAESHRYGKMDGILNADPKVSPMRCRSRN